MKCLIVSGGNAPSRDLMLKYSSSNLIIAADKGASYLLECGIIPHVLIGDFDSLDQDKLTILQNVNCKVIKYNKEKDFTDTESCLRYAMEASCDDITILGAIGTRIDHTLANINLLCIPFNEGVNCIIEDERNRIFLTRSPLFLKKDDKKYFSIFPHTDELTGLNIVGAKFELKNYNLNKNSTLTISNEFLNDVVKIDFNKGTALIIESDD